MLLALLTPVHALTPCQEALLGPGAPPDPDAQAFAVSWLLPEGPPPAACTLKGTPYDAADVQAVSALLVDASWTDGDLAALHATHPDHAAHLVEVAHRVVPLRETPTLSEAREINATQPYITPCALRTVARDAGVSVPDAEVLLATVRITSGLREEEGHEDVLIRIGAAYEAVEPEALTCTAEELGLDRALVKQLACVYAVNEEAVPIVYRHTLQARMVHYGDHPARGLINRVGEDCPPPTAAFDLDGDGVEDELVRTHLVVFSDGVAMQLGVAPVDRLEPIGDTDGDGADELQWWRGEETGTVSAPGRVLVTTKR